jgi:non-specific protein-tyrosine kinase
MGLYEYWRLAVRHLPILLLTTILGVSGAIYLNYIAIPQYTASADVFVTTPSTALDIGALSTGSNFSEQRVISYAQIINGPSTLEPVIKRLGLDLTPQELAKQVHATAPNGTVLISIFVTDTDPVKAAAIANAVAEQFGLTVQTLELTDSSSTATSIKVTPVRQANPNYVPSSPKKSLNLALGFILGFGIGAGIVILLLIFDRTVKNEDHLNKLPLLGTIRFDATARDKPLLTDLSKYSARTEAFRQLRTNLQLSDSNSNLKVILITSALPNEGKTTTALNLAFSLSDSGQRVALLDADLRRPQLKLFLQMPDEIMSISDILTSEKNMAAFVAKPNDLMHKINPHLWVLTSGRIPPNAAELVGSENFRTIVYAMRKNFDILIIDCPPTLPIADAAVIAKVADGVLVVVKAGKTRINQFRGAIATLTNVDAPIIGCVLNMIPINRRAEEYGYRYGYSSYYGYKGKQKDKSLYSPEEPYGPAIDAMPQREAIDDFEELQEIRTELRERTELGSRSLRRLGEIVSKQLTRHIETIDGKVEQGSEFSQEVASMPDRGMSEEKVSLKKLWKNLRVRKEIEEVRTEPRTSNDILEEILNSISAKEAKAAKKPAAKKPAAKKPAAKKPAAKKPAAKKPAAKKPSRKT